MMVNYKYDSTNLLFPPPHVQLYIKFFENNYLYKWIECFEFVIMAQIKDFQLRVAYTVPQMSLVARLNLMGFEVRI